MLSKPVQMIAKSVTPILLVFTGFACSSETKQSSNPAPVQPVVASAPTPQAAAMLLTNTPAIPAPIPAVTSPVGTVASNTPSVATVFDCISNESDSGDVKVAKFATFARRAERRSSVPLLTWNSTEFGSDYTPKQRCEIVSQRLTEKVAANNGRLSGLSLTYGKIKDNGLTVICALGLQEQKCNSNNMLFTLNEANAKNPSETLVRIANFSKGKATSDSTTAEIGGLSQYILLETLVTNIFPEEIPVSKPVTSAPRGTEVKSTSNPPNEKEGF